MLRAPLVRTRVLLEPLVYHVHLDTLLLVQDRLNVQCVQLEHTHLPTVRDVSAVFRASIKSCQVKRVVLCDALQVIFLDKAPLNAPNALLELFNLHQGRRRVLPVLLVNIHSKDLFRANHVHLELFHLCQVRQVVHNAL